jgi:hypothetical protein
VWGGLTKRQDRAIVFLDTFPQYVWLVLSDPLSFETVLRQAIYFCGICVNVSASYGFSGSTLLRASGGDATRRDLIEALWEDSRQAGSDLRWNRQRRGDLL